MDEKDILRGMCAVAAKSIIDKAESDRFCFNRYDDDKLRLKQFTLFYVPCESSAKRLSLARKLESKGLIKLHQYRKGAAWTYQFVDFEITNKIYIEAYEIVSKFNFVKGNGFISFPQFSKTKQGFNEIDQLGQKAFDLLGA
ncbi:hypothetical protein DJ533_00025 (plasmid) [Acinetobacter defluvii]|uniref:Uncharacterized protein n=1 Tax=Acinetobacter defluvii TaxID=1871111 RepID=A0A2S2F7Y9_9GAMM|nr:hypothetical protein [Acinetobacter defluvii]AWL27106.1 hypothetical protein DJ533_00025 [Acinetobacter defluvii]